MSVERLEAGWPLRAFAVQTDKRRRKEVRSLGTIHTAWGVAECGELLRPQRSARHL